MHDVPPREGSTAVRTDAAPTDKEGRKPLLAGRYQAGVRFGFFVHPIHKGKAKPPVRVAGAGVDLKFAEVANPMYQRQYDGAAGNPRTIIVARNGNESPLIRLEHQGVVDAHQARAGHLFRALFERLMAGQASPSNIQERVDCTAAPDIFSESRSRASAQLRAAASNMRDDHYDALRFVCGEGHSLRELAIRLRKRPGTSRQIFLDALDRFAELNGLGRAQPKPSGDATG